MFPKVVIKDLRAHALLLGIQSDFTRSPTILVQESIEDRLGNARGLLQA